MLKVTDDSGFLALVVPTAYETFVARHWEFDHILSHFKAQMDRLSLLIWGTGLEGYWKVDVVSTKARAKGFREVCGPLHVVGGSLLLTNYESLTMVAQFEHITLPERHQKDLLVPLADGDYTCRIIQMFDPQEAISAAEGDPDFVVEVLKATVKPAPWQSIPWFKSDG
jgi:hypothetical protein